MAKTELKLRSGDGPVFLGRPFKLRAVSDVPYTGIRPQGKMCEKVEEPGYESHVELEFLNPEEAERAGSRIALHKCVRPKSAEGEFVPMQRMEDFFDTLAEHKACVKQRMVGARESCMKDRPSPVTVKAKGRGKSAKRT